MFVIIVCAMFVWAVGAISMFAWFVWADIPYDPNEAFNGSNNAVRRSSNVVYLDNFRHARLRQEKIKYPA